MVGTGIAPLQPPQSSHTPGTPPPHPMSAAAMPDGGAREPNSAVGLKSVRQLSLDGHFSGFQTITEVYNLAVAGK